MLENDLNGIGVLAAGLDAEKRKKRSKGMKGKETRGQDLDGIYTILMGGIVTASPLPMTPESKCTARGKGSRDIALSLWIPCTP